MQGRCQPLFQGAAQLSLAGSQPGIPVPASLRGGTGGPAPACWPAPSLQGSVVTSPTEPPPPPAAWDMAPVSGRPFKGRWN